MECSSLITHQGELRRARLLAVPFPHEEELCSRGEEYRKAWRRIQDLFHGGACAAALVSGRENQWMQIVAILKGLHKERADGYETNLRAYCSDMGNGVTQNLQQARILYLDAGNLGLPSAWFNLGTFYASGRDGKFQYVKAVRCFQRGAEAGCVLCQNKLRNLAR